MISRGTAVTLAVMSLALATGPSACTDNKSAETATQLTPEQKRAADSLAEYRRVAAPLLNEHDYSSLLKLPPPPPELQADSIPIRTPDDNPARIGISSGNLLQKFRGGMTGERRTIWSAYGMNERKEEKFNPVIPLPGIPPEQQNINKISIATPEYFYILDPVKQSGHRMTNMEDDTYLLNDSMKTMSFEEFVSTRLGSPEPRLPDTIINGYHLRVFQINTPNFSLTRWVWRGVTMLEHWRGLGPATPGAAPDTIEFYAEPVEIAFNPEIPETMFRPGSEYSIIDGAPTIQGPRPQPTPQGGPGAPGTPGMPPGAPGAPPQPGMPQPGMPQPPPAAPPRQ